MSSVYTELYNLAKTHAVPSSIEEIISIRHSNATHSWGHKFLVSQNIGLQDVMDNTAFASHIASTGRYITSAAKPLIIHSIIVDEFSANAVVHMSYFLQARNIDEVVEQDLIWTLKFAPPVEGGKWLIKESCEFIDGSASARVGTLVRITHENLPDNVKVSRMDGDDQSQSASKAVVHSTPEGVVAVFFGVIGILILTRLSIATIVIITSLTAFFASAVLFFKIESIIQFLLTPAIPIFHAVALLYFSTSKYEPGFVFRAEIDVPMPNMRFLPGWLSISLTPIPEDLEDSPLITIRSSCVDGNENQKISQEQEGAILLQVLLSDKITLAGGKNDCILYIRQQAARVRIGDEAELTTFLRRVQQELQPKSSKNATATAVGTIASETAITISIRTCIRICNFPIFKGTLPTFRLNLTPFLQQLLAPSPPSPKSSSLLQSPSTIPSIHVYETPIAPPKPHIHTFETPTFPPQQPAPPPPPTGATALLPSPTIVLTSGLAPTAGSVVQLSQHATLAFTHAPRLAFAMHEIHAAVHINGKRVTSAIVHPFALQKDTPLHVTVNNPRLLRNGASAAAAFMDVTGLMARVLGFGIGAIEVVAGEAARRVGVAGPRAGNVAVGVKVLRVVGYGVGGEPVELDWVVRVLRGVDLDLGTEVSVFGSGSSPAVKDGGSGDADSGVSWDEYEDFVDDPLGWAFI
ncbi:hypothetical protein HK100_008779 [Physocladia obscura]|uniref:Uncharacterized protein n=1 Tax=Physocladia obscura TaxID=109957 RepID=A0AAD5T3R6_9FUNG|nr:hypothetical protein HK100_008779 [Physocladia obscura]